MHTYCCCLVCVHQITFTECPWPRRSILKYRNATDIMLGDPYPIGRSDPRYNNVSLVSWYADAMLAATDYSLPMMMVPQTFGGSEAWVREPSAQELRAMTYLALIHGVSGVLYFSRWPWGMMPKSPSLWSEARRLSLEAQELSPFLLSAERWQLAALLTGLPTEVDWRASLRRDDGEGDDTAAAAARVLLLLLVRKVHSPVSLAGTMIKLPGLPAGATVTAEALFERHRPIKLQVCSLHNNRGVDNIADAGGGDDSTGGCVQLAGDEFLPAFGSLAVVLTWKQPTAPLSSSSSGHLVPAVLAEQHQRRRLLGPDAGSTQVHVAVPPPAPPWGVDPRNLVANPSFENWPNTGTPDGMYASVGGTERGATMFLDSRTAGEGHHSIRLSSPAVGQGMKLKFFPFSMENGTEYKLSVMLKAGSARWGNVTQRLAIFFGSIEPNSHVVLNATSGEGWVHHEYSGVSTSATDNNYPNLCQLTAGVLFVDLLQVVPMIGGGKS